MDLEHLDRLRDRAAEAGLSPGDAIAVLDELELELEANGRLAGVWARWLEYREATTPLRQAAALVEFDTTLRRYVWLVLGDDEMVRLENEADGVTEAERARAELVERLGELLDAGADRVAASGRRLSLDEVCARVGVDPDIVRREAARRLAWDDTIRRHATIGTPPAHDALTVDDAMRALAIIEAELRAVRAQLATEEALLDRVAGIEPAAPTSQLVAVARFLGLTPADIAARDNQLPDDPYPAPSDPETTVDAQEYHRVSDALIVAQDHVFELVSENRLLRDLLDTERFANRARNAATAELLGPLHDHDTVAALLGDVPDGLLAFHTGDSRVYPAFQFDGAAVIDGITALVELADASGRSHWSIAAWLATPDPALDRRPIDALRAGDTRAVLDIARRWLTARPTGAAPPGTATSDHEDR